MTNSNPVAVDRRSSQFKVYAANVLLAILLAGGPAAPVSAQAVASCQKTAPMSYPPFVDTTATTPGWNPNASVGYAKTHLVLGDIDGDGNDELVALTPQNQVQVWHWIQTGWTPMAAFPSAQIATHPPQHFNQVVAEQINLADVTGNGQKDIVVYVTWENSYATVPSANYRYQEQIYHRNPYTGIWAELTDYVVAAPSIWFPLNRSSPQEARLLSWAPGQFTALNVTTWTNSSWQQNFELADLSLNSSSTCTNTGGPCISLADVNGDGYADLTALRDDGSTVIYLSYPNGNYFAVPAISSKIPKITATNGTVNATSAAVWQISNGLLLFVSPNGRALYAYKFASNGFLSGDFVEVNDPAGLIYRGGFSNTSFPYISPIESTITVAPMTVGTNMAIVVMGSNGVYDYTVTTNAQGQATIGAEELMTPDISASKGFGPSGYSGYFQFGVEGTNQIMIARSSSGVVTRVPSGTATSYAFVDPGTLTDNGYPSFTVNQQVAYEYIGTNTAGNSDLRSLYPDPAVSWASIQAQLETLAAPPAASGIALADFQFVQKQLLQEVAALQSVNLLFSATGQILTNTYLVKDATLSEITDVLNLPSQPDVASAVINDISAGLNGLGAAAEGAGAIFAALKDLTAALNNSGSVLELLGTITGDIATYTTENPVATNSYDLKVALDNSALGALTANSCHQAAALSSWNQSKPIADGLLTGELPLDLETQQNILQATQSLFQLYTWQALVPSKWSYVSALELHPNAGLFQGNATYPSSDTVPANCPAYGELSLVLEDPNTHNFPNIYALNALFNAPPSGLGVNPADVFFGNYGWAVPYLGSDPTLLFNTGLLTYSCSSLTPVSATASVAQIAASASATDVGTAAPDSVIASSSAASTIRTTQTTAVSEAIKNLGQLLTQVRTNRDSEPNFRQRMEMFLDVTITRLRQAEFTNQQPLEALRLLNLFINQSQWNVRQGARDSKASDREALEAVAIRDALLKTLPGAGTM